MAARVIKAYWGSGSQPARKMLLALEEKGLKYESHMISFDKKEHKTPEFLAMNPRGKVPTMMDGDTPIYESLAIVQYLDREYPNPPLLPSDHKGAAKALQRMQETSYLEDAIRNVNRHNNAADKDEAWKTKLEEFKTSVYTELNFWENATNSSQFLVGDKVTVADVAFYPYLDFLVRQGLTFGKFPNLGKYHQHFSCRPSAVNTYPPHWKTTPAPKIYE